MTPLPLPLLLLLLLLSHSSLLPSFAFPSPSSSIPLPTLPSSFTTPIPTTIPAFPEQSAITSSSSCPPFPSAPTSSPPSPPPPPPAPPLSQPSTPHSPPPLSPPTSSPLSLPDLPSLPGDSESCAGQLEKELKAKGVTLPRVNNTCDVTYCYCGIRLRRLSCFDDGFVADVAVKNLLNNRFALLKIVK